jgi:hypothetical protein
VVLRRTAGGTDLCGQDTHRAQEAVALNKRLKLAGATSVSCQAASAVCKGVKRRPDGRVQVQDLLHWQAARGGVDVGPVQPYTVHRFRARMILEQIRST